MKFKTGVKMNGIKPEIVSAFIIVNEVYKQHGKDFVVTSVMDGVHSRSSLHYVGYAFDCRIWDCMPNELVAMQKDMQEYLTDEYDVVLEKDHFHIEFQPKSA